MREACVQELDPTEAADRGSTARAIDATGQETAPET